MIRASAISMKMEFPNVVAALAPMVAAAPAFATTDVSETYMLTGSCANSCRHVRVTVVQAITSMPLSLEVTFAAYLAVLLGTFLPVTFLIALYSQVGFYL